MDEGDETWGWRWEIRIDLKGIHVWIEDLYPRRVIWLTL